MHKLSLEDWIKQNTTKRRFALMVNKSRQAVCNWCSGKHSPDDETLEKIRFITNDTVNISDLLKKRESSKRK